MKLYIDSKNVIYNYPNDGSQDYLIGKKKAITQEQADALVLQNLANKGIPVFPQYVINRIAAYPSINDFADAWVKNDKNALEEYRQKCLAVKFKYPKQTV